MPSTPRCLQPPGTEVNRTRIGGFGVLAVDAAARCLAFSRREADNSVTAPYMHTVLNDCNGELVDVQGTIHMEDHSTTNANGTHIQFTINLSGVKGVAPPAPT
jgi:hypothetical protein